MSDKELTRLIILGAGASVDCGAYPTGAQFIEIAEKILPMLPSFYKSDIGQRLLAPSRYNSLRFITDGSASGFFDLALWKLITSRPSSIDSYIAGINSSEEKDFLKSLIIAIIATSTAYSETYDGKFESNWYFSVWQLIVSQFSDEQSDQEKIEKFQTSILAKVITFNYDVSLEIYLFRRIVANFKNPMKARQFFQIIAERMIVHVYGQVASWRDVVGICEQQGDCGVFGTELTRTKDIFDFEIGQQFKTMKECLAPSIRNIPFAENLTPQSSYHPSEVSSYFHSSVLRSSMSIFLSEDPLFKELRERLSVIGEERKDAKIKVENLVSEEWDLLYILGYGFDSDNNKLLNFENLKKYKHGCFVTNYGGNQKLERLIYDELLSVFLGRNSSASTKNYKIPLISHCSVFEALKNDFSLLENPKCPLGIQSNLSPYLAMRGNSSSR